MFSCVIYGPEKTKLADNGNDIFGENSIFCKLHKKNAKLITFGTQRFDPTFVHYIEQYFHNNLSPLSYRKFFDFSGIKIDKNGNQAHGTIKGYMRNLESNKFYNESNLVSDLYKKNLINKVMVGEGEIYIANANDVFQTGLEGLKKNKSYFIRD